jgi:hypothetical protein
MRHHTGTYNSESPASLFVLSLLFSGAAWLAFFSAMRHLVW